MHKGPNPHGERDFQRCIEMFTSADVMSAELKQLWETLGLAAASGGKSHRSLTPITLEANKFDETHSCHTGCYDNGRHAILLFIRSTVNALHGQNA